MIVGFVPASKRFLAPLLLSSKIEIATANSPRRKEIFYIVKHSSDVIAVVATRRRKVAVRFEVGKAEEEIRNQEKLRLPRCQPRRSWQLVHRTSVKLRN